MKVNIHGGGDYEVSVVFGSIGNIVSTINNFKEGWITPSSECQQQVDILRGRLGTYEEQVSFHEQPVDGTLMRTLKRAESRLKRVEDRLQKLTDTVPSNQCCSQMWWLYAKVSLTLFPENLEKIFKEVIQDLDSIPKILQNEKDLSDRLREASKNQAMSTTIRNNDSKYVPIAKSQEEVINAIEDSDGDLMILLHGGFGKGKSTLARYICHRYGKFGEKSNLFDHVILVSCGNSSVADSSTKQYEILEHLFPRSLIEEDSKSEYGISEIQNGSKSRIEKALEKFLIRKKVLIILDDVRDARFLYEMWKVAKDGKDENKILITSQKFNLCDDFKNDSKLIQMETPTLVEARKILASLVGLERKEIPANLQAIADDVIEGTDRNPLALACLASYFACNQNKKSKRDWQDVWRELPKQLDNKEMAIVLGCNDEIPSKSLLETVKLCIDSMDTKDHAKCILFLMYAFKGESVPEEVLRILWAGMEMPSSTTFNRARNELRMRELLKPIGHSSASKIFGNLKQNNEQLLEARAWSLHSVVKLYMQKTQIVRKEEIRGTIGALLGDEDFPPQSNIECEQDYETDIVEIGESKEMTDEMRVVSGLCALYFDRGHTDPVVTRAVTRAIKISDLEASDNTINDLRRIAVEPLIWLLDKPEEPKGQWTKSDTCRVRKVFLRYICKRELDDENISYLLKLAACPSAQLATLMSLTRISTIEEGLLHNENTITVLKVVIDLLIQEGHHTSVQEAATQTLTAICWNASRHRPTSPWTSLLPNLSRVLGVLVPSLAFLLSKSNALTEIAAHAPRGLASGRGNNLDSARTFLNEQGLLAGLVHCLHENYKPGLQEAAARALGNVGRSANESPKWKIADEDRALVGLASWLSNQDKADSQKPGAAAAMALANLASSVELRFRIIDQEWALAGLVSCVKTHDKPCLQNIAAVALANLASYAELRVANQEGALAGLVNSVKTLVDKPCLQTTIAVVALANLTFSEELRVRVIDQEGALLALVNCLSKDDKPDLQVAAAAALAKLACCEGLRSRIAKQEGALVGLGNCLSKDDKPDLLKAAAIALANLAGSSEAVRFGIANQDQWALAALINCLSKDDRPDLQQMAAWALAHLAISEDLRLRISEREGALIGLGNCLSKEDKPDLLKAAATALANLAGPSEEISLRIANQNGALVGLVNCLSKDDKPDLVKAAATTLGNLAGSSEGVMLGIANLVVNQEKALGGLVNCLSKDDKPDLQQMATWFLGRHSIRVPSNHMESFKLFKNSLRKVTKVFLQEIL